MSKLEYMEFPFKETPDYYMNNEQVDVLDDVLGGRLNDLLGKYTKAYFLQESNDYKEFNNELNEFQDYLKNHPQLKESVEEYMFCETPTILEFEKNKKYMENYTVEIDADIKRKMNGKYPVYIIFNGSTSLISKVIRLISGGDFSHASLSLTGVDEIISFGNNSRNDGLIVENIFELYARRQPEYLKVVALLVNHEVFKEMYKVVHQFRKNMNNYKYATKELVMFPFLKKKSHNDINFDKQAFYCTQFVAWVISNVSLNFDNMNVTPSELSNNLDGMVETITIFDGMADGFNESKVREFEKLVQNKKKRLVREVEDELMKEELVSESNQSFGDHTQKISQLSNIIYREANCDRYNSKYHMLVEEIIF